MSHPHCPRPASIFEITWVSRLSAPPGHRISGWLGRSEPAVAHPWWSSNDIHSMLTRVLVEEYGGGKLSRKHSTFFTAMLNALEMRTEPEAYFDLVPWKVLAGATTASCCQNANGFICATWAGCSTPKSQFLRHSIIIARRPSGSFCQRPLAVTGNCISEKISGTASGCLRHSVAAGGEISGGSLGDHARL